MKKHKVISVSADENGDSTVNKFLENGWLVKNMITERIVTSVSGSGLSRTERGKIVYLLEKEV